MTLFSNMAIQEIQDEIEANLADGFNCPCCGSYCKMYKRKLNHCMAASLCWMVANFDRHSDNGWIHVNNNAPRHVVKNHETSMLVYWGLVDPKPNMDDPSKRCSGFWRPTDLGNNFARNKITVPKYVWVYQNTVRDTSSEHTTIMEAIGNYFNYSELMGYGVDGG